MAVGMTFFSRSMQAIVGALLGQMLLIAPAFGSDENHSSIRFGKNTDYWEVRFGGGGYDYGPTTPSDFTGGVDNLEIVAPSPDYYLRRTGSPRPYIGTDIAISDDAIHVIYASLNWEGLCHPAALFRVQRRRLCQYGAKADQRLGCDKGHGIDDPVPPAGQRRLRHYGETDLAAVSQPRVQCQPRQFQPGSRIGRRTNRRSVLIASAAIVRRRPASRLPHPNCRATRECGSGTSPPCRRSASYG